MSNKGIEIEPLDSEDILATTGQPAPQPVPALNEMPPPPSPDNKVRGVVDIVFLVDATGSMGPCIESIKESLASFIDVLTTPNANGGYLVEDWRGKICAYRDFVYDRKKGREYFIDNPFVHDAGTLKAQLSKVEAAGGGDEPESLLDALYVLTKQEAMSQGETNKDPMKWRALRESARVVIVFTDASFHPELSECPGAGLEDVMGLIKTERFLLYIFAPEMECYYALSEVDKSQYSPIPILDPSEEHAPVKALRDYISNKEQFKEVMEMLAKSVSQSSVMDIE